MSGERTMRAMSQEPGNRSSADRRVSSRIRHEVVQLILDRKLRAGSPLPTETELMAALGASRNSVREALKALQALDIVDIRHGYGMYVGRASLAPLIDGLTFRTLTQHDDEAAALGEILQVRQVLEEGLIGRVVPLLGEPDLDRLDAVVTGMETAGRSGLVFPELDREFHELLYQPLGNALLPQLLGAFWSVFHQVSRRGTPTPPSLTAARHRAIVTALRARDVEGAKGALGEHFRGVGVTG